MDRVLQPLEERLKLVDSPLQGFDAPLVPCIRCLGSRIPPAATQLDDTGSPGLPRASNCPSTRLVASIPYDRPVNGRSVVAAAFVSQAQSHIRAVSYETRNCPFGGDYPLFAKGRLRQ
jgi:hypothetical protein